VLDISELRPIMAGVEHPLLVLTPRPWKWLRVLAICLLFVAGGWWMAHGATETFKRGVGWFCVVLFGLNALVSVIQLIPGSAQLVATSEGLYVKTFLRSYHFAWNEIERFGSAEWTQWHGPFRQRHRLVGILFVDGSKHLSRYARMQAWTTAFIGYHAALPDNYGLKHQVLADRLNGLLAEHRK
jgi:hypothetical protein